MRTEKGFNNLVFALVAALLLGSVAFLGISPINLNMTASPASDERAQNISVSLNAAPLPPDNDNVVESKRQTENAQLDKLSIGIQHQLERMADNEEIRIIIRLEPADLENVEAALVVNALKEHTSRTQGQAMGFLHSQGARVLNKFWLANAILAEVEISTIYELTSLLTVRRIHEDFQVMALGPVITALEPVEVFVSPSSTDATWGLSRIGAPDAWALGVKGSGIRVAVLDSGVEEDHPDLVGKMWTDNAEDPTYPGGWIEFDGNGQIVVGSTPHDDYGHGTHCSGTVLGDNESGTAIGVAPGAWLMHALIMPEEGTFAQCVAGMEWACNPIDQYGNPAGQRADVASMSWGWFDDCYGYWDDMMEPIRNMKATGVVPVAAIGNGGEGTSGSPGNVYEAFGIGAIAEDNTVASFSSGELVSWPESYPDPYVKPDFSAPGVSVYSSVPGGYENKSGTSMAAPHVAGTIALMLEANPLLMVDDIYDTLKSTSDDLGSPGKDTRFGWGVIDAFDAVTMVRYNSGIEGYVIDASTSDGVSGAKVTVQETGWARYTAENGYYRIFLPPDNYTLTVSAFGYDDNDNIAASVVENQLTILNIALSPLLPRGFIAGEVTDNASNNPIENASVTLLGTPLSTRTDNMGNYSFGVPVLSYDVKASAWGYRSTIAYNVEVLENQTTVVNFQLEPWHAPIYIEGNEDFTAANGVVAGSGTENDPYIIENWEINAENAHGIWINDTDAHFVIRHCYIHGGLHTSNWKNGILFENVRYGKIDDVVCHTNYHGIIINGSNNVVTNCIVKNNDTGIAILGPGSDNDNIENCTASNNQVGIEITRGNYIRIENCTISNSTDLGIVFTLSENNNVKNCVVHSYGYCIRFWYYTYNNLIENCTILGLPTPGGSGIRDDSGSNRIRGCTIKNRDIGIELNGSNSLIENCTIENNNYGIYMWAISYNNNRIYHNNFVNNTTQAYDGGTNYWDDGYPSGGNYWDDYAGSDANGDGIGDTPYDILGGNNQDRYPLVNPWPVPHLGTAVFSLVDLYTVNVEKILALNQGSKLVVKFYTYGDAYENENVVENFSPPWHVEENESARHPEGVGVKKARLVLTTDNTEEVISTITSFTVRRSNLVVRISAIKGRWPFALPEERNALIGEISGIKGQWPFAPP